MESYKGGANSTDTIFIPKVRKFCFWLKSHRGTRHNDGNSDVVTYIHCIPQPIRCTFFPEKCDLNSACVLCTKGKYYFQTYKYLYPHRVKTTMKIILVAVTTIFWVSVMNKLYYGC
jgi:hypothetical protein